MFNLFSSTKTQYVGYRHGKQEVYSLLQTMVLLSYSDVGASTNIYFHLFILAF